MSGLADLARRQQRLGDIRGLMTAMKSLSLLEVHKLARRIEHQRRMRENIEAAAADFLRFHPGWAVEPDRAGPSVVVLVGSERGFCGGFNERILKQLGAGPFAAASLLAVGTRLASRLAGRAGMIGAVEGATVAEDVPAVFDRVVAALRDRPAGTLACLAHDEHGEPGWTTLWPMAVARPPAAGAARGGHAPQLNLAPAALHAALLDQFLLASLQGLLVASLAAESRQRLAHLEQALDRLDRTALRLTLRRNLLRQERIVEEIEVMLSSAMATHARARRGAAAAMSAVAAISNSTSPPAVPRGTPSSGEGR